MKERKDILVSVIMYGAIIIFITVILPTGLQFVYKNNQMHQELGANLADFKWLNREGQISKEEVQEVQEAVWEMNDKELNQLLKRVLDGKEEKYLNERAESLEKLKMVFE